MQSVRRVISYVAAVNMTVNLLLPVSVTVAPSANPVCAGTSVTFTATPVNEEQVVISVESNGVNVGINSPTYSYVPLNTDAVTVVLTSNAVVRRVIQLRQRSKHDS